MGGDTKFHLTELRLSASEEVEQLGKKIMDLYEQLHKEYNIQIGNNDWRVEGDLLATVDDDDDLDVVVDSRAHRGSIHDFIGNLILLLRCAEQFGAYAFGRLPFTTYWGISSSGVLRVNKTVIQVVEVFDDSTVVQYIYNLADEQHFIDGSFYDEYNNNSLAKERETTLYTPT